MVYAQGTFYPGKIWKDNRGIHINAHGGGVMEYDGTYYWFGEHKADTTSSAYVGVTCYSSNNLTNWKYEGVALSVVDEKGHDIEKGCVLAVANPFELNVPKVQEELKDRNSFISIIGKEDISELQVNLDRKDKLVRHHPGTLPDDHSRTGSSCLPGHGCKGARPERSWCSGSHLLR